MLSANFRFNKNPREAYIYCKSFHNPMMFNRVVVSPISTSEQRWNFLFFWFQLFWCQVAVRFWIFKVSFFCQFFSKVCFDCNKDYSDKISKLKRRILCNYDKSVSPGKHLIPVSFTYILKSFDFVSRGSSNVSINNRIIPVWTKPIVLSPILHLKNLDGRTFKMGSKRFWGTQSDFNWS
jgi:hypothetical protein